MKCHLCLLIGLLILTPSMVRTQSGSEIKLTAADSAPQNAFGFAVAIDSDYAIVGAFLDNNEKGEKAGAAYIFKREGTTWIQQAKLIGDDVDAGDRLGADAAIDGDYAIVTAASDNDDGAAYVFKREGTTWTQQAKLTPSDSPLGERFGSCVTLEGDYAIVGGFDGNTEIGGLYVFRREDTTWTQQARLVPNDLAERDGFGLSVELSGGYAIAGSRYRDENGENSGAAYIFKRDGSAWTQQIKLIGNNVGAGHWLEQALQ
ncbi:MAG: FG-GAP repeat protein [Calditrichaeota bacterium]|nr:FG-GAP repeat protein [Calditrichota bacterium]